MKKGVNDAFDLTVADCRKTIAARNDELRAVLRVLDEPSLDRDAQANGPLAGVPYVLKDTWDTAGIVTTGGSLRHRDRIPTVSSKPYLALAHAGAVLLGKSNLSDLAFSIESDNHLFGPVRNPWDRTRTAGGSTGGGSCAVATGMAAFEWGTDFGGSLRLPAAFCGVVGLRLAAKTWPVEREHFPRIAPSFWSFCGQGPVTKSVQHARIVMRALAPALRTADPRPAIDSARVALYAPDRAHEGAWPTFARDVGELLARAGVLADVEHGLPPPSHVNDTFDGYLASHFRDLASSEEMSILTGLSAVGLGLASRGRLDKRIHPNTATLFLLAAIGKVTIFPRRAPRAKRLEALRADAARLFDGGPLLVTPTTTELPPKHGRAAFALRVATFCKLGNAIDAVGIAIPFGRFPGTSLPRSIQILGPAGSEEAVLDMAEKLSAAA
ncbi:Asp-tRNA(Asn)/Glu-tRNA(Gln) amidotransferase subunit GatA [soil metagenome]